MEILKQINIEKYDYENKDIQIVPGFSFNQNDTIEQIYFYYNSKFKTGDIDSEGDRKYFYNIVRNPCKITTKAIDFDTKHIKIQTAAGSDSLKTWFFERDLKFWMKDKQFGKVLNRIFEELPIFGSVVLKMVDGIPYFVDLRNFIIEQASDTIKQSNFVTEIHNYNPGEFREAGKVMKWNSSKIEEAIDLFRQMKGRSYITVYERYGEVTDTEDDGSNTYTYKRVFVADVGVDDKDQMGHNIPYKGVVLLEQEWSENPYWEFHLYKMPGRWLGMGIVESLFEPQIRQNEIANLQAKSSCWAALQLFQCRDQGVNRNDVIDARNGEILGTDSEITKIDITERNLAFFNEETRKWQENRDELTFSYDVVQGERLPAGTPLGSARLAAAMTGSHFDQIQENIALDVKEFLFKTVIPEFEKQNTGEHVLRIAGEDLDKVRNMMISQKTTNALFDFLKRKAKLPTKIQFDAIKAGISERVKQGKEKLLEIPQNFYNQLKYKIDIIITGEQKDTSVWAATLFAALQALTADPTLLSDPTKRKVFGKWLEAGGLNIADIEPEMKASSAEQLTESMPVKGAGGGVSRPSLPASPVPGQTQTAL